MFKRAFLLLIVINLSCATGTSRLIEAEKLNFSYTDDAYLFFRNMRQTGYHIENLEDKEVRLYTHDDYADKSPLKTTMVANWKANKAYAIMVLRDSVSLNDISIYWKGEVDKGEVIFPNTRRQGELVALTAIYNHMLQQHELSIEIEGGREELLFADADSREAFRISMYDFYRLTGVL